MTRFASRARRYLRLSALVLLLLATVINPVFAAVGDLHEAVRGVAEHIHDGGEPKELMQAAAHDEDGNGGDLMHALMHASHCCGHLTAILAGAELIVAAVQGCNTQSSVLLPNIAEISASDIRPPIGL
ncbi:hypothetical protein SAMN05428989_1523 [Pseudoxanthomonas sp. GM95]|uniref:hypothetical protein n=1 Tax=Pseudoxanthomonas sp. GM95 TaxID=1881043 RepID=UPI0008B3D943|nr:hypothetical protein [Pseudoxanthomonas sp. GM95]SEL13660.1 hypothetical protein SAMN05428989_1523 [Pseudoxanthomonas sp. GM95]